MNIEQDPSDLQDESALARFSARTRRALEAFRKSGMAERIEREAESETIEERRSLLADLASARKEYKATVQPLDTAAAKALRAFEEAERSLMAARTAMHRASQAATGHEVSFLAEEKRITTELRLSADPRIAVFREFIDNLRSEDLPGALRFDFAEGSESGKGARGLHIVSNSEQCATARAAIQDALAAVDALMLEAIGYVDVSERMIAICEGLAPALEAISLNPPSLTAADAEPGPPVAFKGASVWIVDKAVALRGEEVDARRAAAATRINDSARVG